MYLTFLFRLYRTKNDKAERLKRLRTLVILQVGIPRVTKYKIQTILTDCLEDRKEKHVLLLTKSMSVFLWTWDKTSKKTFFTPIPPTIHLNFLGRISTGSNKWLFFCWIWKPCQWYRSIWFYVLVFLNFLVNFVHFFYTSITSLE